MVILYLVNSLWLAIHMEKLFFSFNKSKLFGKCFLVIILSLSHKFLDNSDKLPLTKLQISNNLKEYFIFLNLKSIILKDSHEFSKQFKLISSL